MAFVTKINTDVMNTADVMSVAGKRIVDFCRDYHMYFMTLLPKDLESKLFKENDHLPSHLLMITIKSFLFKRMTDLAKDTDLKYGPLKIVYIFTNIHH